MIRSTIATLAILLLANLAAADEVGLTIEDAWVRAMPSTHSMTAAYMSIVNDTDSAYGIIGATADVARIAEIHTTRNVDGFMQMQEVEGLAIAPGERVDLEPGGTHVMLMGLTFMPEPGDTVHLCLKLLGDRQVCTEAVTRRR